MGEALSRSVEIHVSNKTQDVTLEKPRTYLYNGYCSVPPHPLVLPGSNDSCTFSNLGLKGCVGVLVYEAATFTLATYFCNPLDYNLFSMELCLEISLSKSHLGRLEHTYARMCERSSVSNLVTASDRIVLDTCQEVAEVSAGPVRVMAAMSNSRKSVVRLVVENVKDSEMRAWKETRSPGKHVQEK